MRTVFEAAGDIRSVDLLAALVSFWRTNASGSVRFSRPGESAGFDLSSGQLVGVFSSEARFETAAVLVRAGKLDKTTLNRLAVPPGGDAAGAALQAGILTRREWRWGKKIRAIEILSDLLGWGDGKYLFDSGARPAAGDFTLTIPRLVLELFLRSRDRNLIEQQLGPFDVPLIRATNFDQEFPTFGLTADAESVVRLIDGRASGAQIARKAPADEFAVLKLLAALATLGLVRPADAAAERVATGEAAPEMPPEQGPGLAAASQPEAVEERPPAKVLPAAEALDAVALPHPEDAAVVPEIGVPWAAAEREGAEPWQDSKEEKARESSPADFPMPMEPPAPAEPQRRISGGLFVSLLVLLVAAVFVVLNLRSRAGSTDGPVVRKPSPARSAPAAASAGSLSLVPSPAPTQGRPAPPTARPGVAKPPAAQRPDSSRDTWLQRAEGDRRRLLSEPQTRYAIQLLLACEVPTLVDAWKHDRPAGSMWLLTAPHGSRQCFRVLWGRFATLEGARAAKGSIPGVFVTRANRPAVVSVH